MTGRVDVGHDGWVNPAAAPAYTRQPLLATIALLSTLLLAAVLLVMPTGYTVGSPGPTADTLGTVTGTVNGIPTEIPLVTISGAPTYDASGQLRLTTLSRIGGPGSSVFPMDVIRAWPSSQHTVLPTAAVIPQGVTREEQREQAAVQMATSQEVATAAALTLLGVDYASVLRIAGPVEGSNAQGVVEEGDQLVSLNGVDVSSHADLIDLLEQITPGSQAQLGVIRGGQQITLTFETGEAVADDGSSRAALGIWVGEAFTFPIDVTIRIDDIGGPSAGVMFALAIMDLLTPDDVLQGAVVAGTGSITADGAVLPVGGVRQKMYGSVRDGAQYFLVPWHNCGDVIGHTPDGLRVVPVGTLADAFDAITAIGQGSADSLPVCG